MACLSVTEFVCITYEKTMVAGEVVLHREESSFLKVRGSTKTSFKTWELWGWRGRFPWMNRKFLNNKNKKQGKKFKKKEKKKCSVQPVEGGSQNVKFDKHTKSTTKWTVARHCRLSSLPCFTTAYCFLQQLSIQRKRINWVSFDSSTNSEIFLIN